jgi:hypothetical protein
MVRKVCENVDTWIEENVEKLISKVESFCSIFPWPVNTLCKSVTTIVKVVVKVVRLVVIVICTVIVVTSKVIKIGRKALRGIPIVGRIVDVFEATVNWVVSIGIGVLDAIGRFVGIRTTKHLRIHVFSLTKNGVTLATAQQLQPILDQTAMTLYDQAQIRLHATVEAPITNHPESMLRIQGGGGVILDNLGVKGGWLQSHALDFIDELTLFTFDFGRPILVYIIEDVVDVDTNGNAIGASTGPLADWVAVEATAAIADQQPPSSYNKFVLAHEIGHSLGLLGHANSSPGDLMYDSTLTGDHLSPFQVSIIRSSPHVTFF